MACTLVILGWDPANKLDPVAAHHAPLVQGIVSCSPNCHDNQLARVIVVPGNPPQVQVDWLSNSVHKPVEAYLLAFASDADAKAWVQLFAAQLVHKTIYLIEGHATPGP